MAGRKSDFTLPTNTLDELFSTQEERDDAKLSKIRDIPLELIDDFPDHPFKVRDDEDMIQLVESVKERGVITPATVRQKEDGRYELISGHRRKRACELAGFEALRCEVVDLDRDAATVLMVESNYQRSQILPSEKAFAYKMRLEAMSRQGKRTDLTSTPAVEKLSGKDALSVTAIGNEVGESREQIRRYINSTISPSDMKLFIGRIMQYGYTGPISTSWRSQNPADAATLAEAMATQVLIWETVVGERDEDFDYVSPGSYDAVKGVISTAHPLNDLFCDYYDSIEASVQRHSAIPSFISKNPNRAQSVELEWDGSGYTATLTDHNRVLSDYNFSANEDGISFSVSGNQLIITATDAPSDSVRITANKVGSTRRGIITWTDGTFNQGSGKQDVITYAQSVSDPVQAFLNLKVSYGSAKIVKTSEDGKVDNLTFTVTGNGINQTVKTNSKGEIQIPMYFISA